tara:strand:- start:289 stop:579 length:291 start_codon:yes stop_codon:yes gene_type:complete
VNLQYLIIDKYIKSELLRSKVANYEVRMRYIPVGLGTLSIHKSIVSAGNTTDAMNTAIGIVTTYFQGGNASDVTCFEIIEATLNDDNNLSSDGELF